MADEKTLKKLMLFLRIIVFSIIGLFSLYVYSTLIPPYDHNKPDYLLLIFCSAIFLKLIKPITTDFFSKTDARTLNQSKTKDAIDALIKLLEKRGRLIFQTFLFASMIFHVNQLGLFSAEIITNNDHPYHYYQAWYAAKYLLPEFKNILGWSPFFYGGYPIMYHYQPGNALFSSLLYVISDGVIPLQAAYRIFIIFALFAAPLSVYYLVRELEFPGLACTIIGILAVIPNFRSVELLYWGMSSSVLASNMSPIVFALLHRYYKTKSRVHLVASMIVFSSLIIVHCIIAFGVFLGILLYLFMRRETSIKVIAPVAVIPFLLSAFWILPAANFFFSGYGNLDVIIPYLKVKTVFGFLNYHAFLLIGMPLLLWPIAYYGFKTHLHAKSFPVKFIAYYAILLYFTAYFGSIIPKVQEIQTLHLMPTLGVYLIIVTGLGLSKLVTIRRWRTYAIMIFALAAVTPLYGTYVMHSKIQNPEETIMSYGLPEDVEEVFNWIKGNSGGRTLIEDTDPLLMKTPWGRGYNLALAPVLATESLFIGGPLPYYNPFWTGNLTRTKEGVFFGLSVGEIAHSVFKRRLDEFNIQKVIVWSNKSKDFLNNVDGFEVAEIINQFSVYRYLDARDSFIVRVEGDVSADVLEFGVKEIRLLVNANESGSITVSSSYYPNWNAIHDGRRIPVFKDEMFARVVVDENPEPYEVLLVFEESNLEWFSKWLSVISWIIVLPAILFMRWRRL